jgi:hypothetical protein
VHSGKESRKDPRKYICERARKENKVSFVYSKRKQTHHHSHPVAPTVSKPRSANPVSSGSKAGYSAAGAATGGASEPPTGSSAAASVSTQATSPYGNGAARDLAGGGAGDCVPRARGGGKGRAPRHGGRGGCAEGCARPWREVAGGSGKTQQGDGRAR